MNNSGYTKYFTQYDLEAHQKKESFIERPRISRLLENAIQHPLSIVCAGSGYGKTSSVYYFLQQRHSTLPFWFWFTEQDNIEASFWANYIHSVYSRNPELLKSLLETGLPKTDKEYEKYFAFLRATQPMVDAVQKYVLIYDDFHCINNPYVLKFMEMVIRARITKRSIILLSRTDPSLSMPYLNTLGNVPSIAEEELRFTESEIADYLKHMGLSVSTQGIYDIYQDTQGWAFALSLVGRSLKKSPEYHSDIFGAMRNNVYRIFETDVFRTISAELKNLLLRLSLLNRLPSDLVKELDPQGNLKEEMEQQSAYIRYDPMLDTYIIHHLLLAYLQDHQHLLSEEEKKATYKTAADFSASHSYKTDAISYYEKAEDYHTLFVLITNEINTQIPTELAEYLLEVFQSIPAEKVMRYNLFSVLHMRILISLGRIEEAISVGKQYEKEFLSLPETVDSTRTLSRIYMALGLTRQLQSVFIDTYDFDAYYIKQNEYFNKSPYSLSSEYAIRPLGSWGAYISNVGAARQGALEEYIAALERSEPYTIQSQNGYGAGLSDIARGELLFYRNNPAEAEKCLARGLSKAQSYGQYDLMHKAYFYAMRIAFMRGNAAAAFQALNDIKSLLTETKYLPRYTTHDIVYGWFCIKLGRLELMPQWLTEDFLPYAHAKYLENYSNNIKMDYCFAVNNYTAILNFAKMRLKRETIIFERLETQIMEACAHFQMKNRTAAFASLCEAYETASPNQLVTPFIELGKHMRALTSAALRSPECPLPEEWLQAINRQASSYAKYQAYITTEYNLQNTAVRETSLSERERQILIGLSRGLSRSEIATNLGISINSIKLMIGNLYDKIGASNLADAIRIGLGEKWI